jgi:hypothetical protein
LHSAIISLSRTVEIQILKICSFVDMIGILAQETGLSQNNQRKTNLQYAPNRMSKQDANIGESEVLRKRKHLVRGIITYAQ